MYSILVHIVQRIYLNKHNLTDNVNIEARNVFSTTIQSADLTAPQNPIAVTFRAVHTHGKLTLCNFSVQ